MSRRDSIIIRAGKVKCFMIHKLPPATATASLWSKDFCFKEVFIYPAKIWQQLSFSYSCFKWSFFDLILIILPEKEKHNMPVWLFSQLLFRFWLSQIMLWPDGAPCRQDRRPEGAEGTLWIHCHLELAVSCSHYLLSGSLFRICWLVERDKTATLRHIKHHTAQKVLEADPTASGLLRLSCPLMW